MAEWLRFDPATTQDRDVLDKDMQFGSFVQGIDAFTASGKRAA